MCTTYTLAEIDAKIREYDEKIADVTSKPVDMSADNVREANVGRVRELQAERQVWCQRRKALVAGATGRSPLQGPRVKRC